MNMDFDFIVIGTGVVGLSVSELLARKKYKVLAIEKENRIGTGVSSRNSEVIHAGIYYPKDSLKSSLCIQGKELLYQWCRSNNISCKNIGKYIIAVNNDELERLEKIKINALNAGMSDLHFVSSTEIRKEEPEINTVGGLFSPTTGIVSAHELMDSLRYKAEQNGADFLFNSYINSVSKNSSGSGYIAEIIDASMEISTIEVGGIINCAGLYADKTAKLLNVYSEGYKQKFVKGNYFRLKGGRNLFKHLIYPVPMPKLYGLGVHITLDLNGEIRFGPDTETLENNVENYSVDELRKDAFYTAVKKYYKDVDISKLEPDMAGIRPKLASESEFNDFIITEESGKGMPGIVTCAGIESPGLTASLAIAEYILNIIK